MNPEQIIEVLRGAAKSLAHSSVANYVVPGLTSSLIGGNGHGAVRLFECSREHEENIVPHSHRFPFTCIVLAGTVRNRIWTKHSNGDHYQSSQMRRSGEFGQYITTAGETEKWTFKEQIHNMGEAYSMFAYQVHSIYFSKGAKVLFFEGPESTDESIFLQPVVDGDVIPTFNVQPWMFQRESASKQAMTQQEPTQ